MIRNNDNTDKHDAGYAKIESVVGGMHKPQLPDIETEWADLEKRIDAVERKTPSIFTTTRIFVAASVGVVVLLLGLYGFLTLNVTSHTTAQNKNTITLPDGSEICMNRNSSIRYNAGYGIINRKIKLTGEAFFKVKKGNKPFIVSTPEATIKVTGTQFNIKARLGSTKVGVSEGRVEFSSTKIRSEAIVLTKGLYAVCKDNEAPSQAIHAEPSEFTGWMDNRLVYRDTPVKEIFADIEEQFSVKIETHDSQILQLKVSGILTGEKPDEILQTLCALIGKKVKGKGNVYEVY